jgi:hypothetical protein
VAVATAQAFQGGQRLPSATCAVSRVKAAIRVLRARSRVTIGLFKKTIVFRNTFCGVSLA